MTTILPYFLGFFFQVTIYQQHSSKSQIIFKARPFSLAFLPCNINNAFHKETKKFEENSETFDQAKKMQSQKIIIWTKKNA